MDTHSLGCEVVFVQKKPPQYPDKYFFLEQVIGPGEKMRSVERDQLTKCTLSANDLKTDLQLTLCSICLSDYQTYDNVVIMPNCCHYFHQNCLDVWLTVG